MQKIAIWYIWAGVGHYRPAKALFAELTQAGYHVDVINPLEVLANSDSLWGRLMVNFHLKSNDVFKFAMSNLKFSNDIQRQPGFLGHLIEGGGLAFYKKFQRFIGRRVVAELSLREYDAVICTNPIPCGIAVGVAEAQNLTIPIINIFPDEALGLTGNFYTQPGTYMTVNSKRVRDYYVQELGVCADKIFITGYVGDPMLVDHRQKIYSRVQETLKAGRLNIGLYLGGYCPDSQQQSILSIISQLADLMKEGRVTVRVITGPHYQFDRKVRDLIKKLGVEDQIIIGRSDDLKEVVEYGHRWMLEDVNVMFSRPSELVFYSLITGIPHILFPPVGGQEYDMRQMLIDFAGVADYSQIKKHLVRYLDDKEQLMKISHDLFHSGYNLDGCKEMVKLLKQLS